MHGFAPYVLNSPYGPVLFVAFAAIVAATLLWTLVLKGYALWFAARNNQRGWFIALLIINTVGILEIIYLIWYRPKTPTKDESAPVLTSSSVR